MPGLAPTNLHPLPGDPWRAEDHNAVVDQSVAITEATLHEHGDAGDHADIQFAVAGGLLLWSGSAWSLVRSHGIASVSGTYNRPTIVLERPMLSAAEWGVIASVQTLHTVEMLEQGKTTSQVSLRTSFSVPAGSYAIGIIVIGPHAPL